MVGAARPRLGSYGRTRFVETSGDTKIQDAAVNMWAMRAFDVQTTTDLHGAIISTLTQTPQTGLVKGSLTNHTPYTLTECHLYLSGQWQTLSDLPAGGTQSVVGSFPLGPVAPPRGGPQGGTPPGWASMPTILGRNDKTTRTAMCGSGCGPRSMTSSATSAATRATGSMPVPTFRHRPCSSPAPGRRS